MLLIDLELVVWIFYFVTVSYDMCSYLDFLKRGNFRCTDKSVGVETQLNNLASITRVIDPKLHQHLGIFLSVCFCLSFSCGETRNIICSLVCSLCLIVFSHADGFDDILRKIFF